MSDEMDDGIVARELIRAEVANWARGFAKFELGDLNETELTQLGVLVHLDRVATALEVIAEKLK